MIKKLSRAARRTIKPDQVERMLVPMAVALVAGAMLVEPAFAQTTGGGTSGSSGNADILATLQNIVNYMNSGVGRLIGVLSLMGSGICWQMGFIDFRKMAAIGVGLGMFFGSATLIGIWTQGG